MTDSNLKIIAEPRNILGRKVQILRKEGNIPAVVYGSNIESTPITLNTKSFIQLYKEAGESTIIDLMIEGEKEPLKVLIKEVDVDYVKRRVLHVSFYKVNMNVEITAVIPFEFINEAPAEKTGAVVLRNIDEVEVKCLPKDLPDHFDIDLSNINEIGDSFTFAQIELPKGVEILMEEEELSRPIITAIAPVTEEEEAAKLAEGEAPIEDVEVTQQGEEDTVAEESESTEEK